ncbi:MAG TPA: DUF4129 domain-containing protein [Gemmata sp.]|nr:DUF4129 domain-containing protein [Gemmata sp.]
MASEREPPTTTDYVVTALSPVLIMLMVGSLVFFLVEVLYDGKYSGRLLYTLFFFVLGAVLVARIAIEKDATRASAYGLLLGIVTYIALLTYVEYPGGGWLKSFGWLVNLGLMLLIWWSANKLTWDCTNIDEKRKGAGRGILSAAGLDVDAKEQESDKKESKTSTKRKGKKKNKRDSKLWDWIENYKKHRETQQKGPHTPGVWVIYFALAALPLFALGQSLIDPKDDERRQASFMQMAVYVGSALALLVTTSFLGLRRYLRQRKAKIPIAMTVSWLGFGAALIVVFLVLGTFLPRPHSEVPWFGISRAGKSEREASKYALNKGSAGKGQGASGDKSKAGDGNASGKGGKAGGKGKGEKSGAGKGEKGKSGKDNNGKSGGKTDPQKGKGDGHDKAEDKSEDKSEKKQAEDDSENQGDKEREKDEDEEDSESKDNSDGKDESSTQLGQFLDKVSGFLKWIVFAVVAVLVVIAVGLAILRYLAPFTAWAQRLLEALRNWWAGLFGGGATSEKKEVASTAPVGPVRPPPFREFPNPFADGSAERREPAELVDYTFLALDSWAWDRDCGREPTETPLEFARRLGETFPDLAEILNRFAISYAKVTYSEFPLPDDTLTMLEEMWEGMVYGVAVG